MEKLIRLYSVLILLLLYSVAYPEHKALADNYPIQGTSQDSIWHPGSVNTSPQERTQESGGPALMIGQRLERALPSPAKIDPTEYQKRGTTKEPEALTPDKITTLQDACDKYAKDAVLQNQENLKIGCGLSSSRWSSDYKAHFNWCMSGNLNNTKGENTARQQALAQCRKDKCDTYAKDAVAAYQLSYSKYCANVSTGFSGPAWNPNYSYHFNWCMIGNNVTLGTKETEARTASLQKCTTCYQYGDNAALQNKQNLAKGCGFSGPSWNSDPYYHFKWCMVGDNMKFASDETKKRDDSLKYNCPSKSLPTPPPPPQTKTTIINGFKQTPYQGKFWYMAPIQISNGVLISVKNPIGGLGKQWIVLIIPAGVSSEDCGKPGKTIDIYPGASTTKLQNTPLTNLILGFCLTTTDTFTYNLGLPAIWSLEITYRQ